MVPLVQYILNQSNSVSLENLFPIEIFQVRIPDNELKLLITNDNNEVIPIDITKNEFLKFELQTLQIDLILILL